MAFQRPEDWPSTGTVDGKTVELTIEGLSELSFRDFQNLIVDVPDVGKMRPWRGVDMDEIEAQLGVRQKRLAEPVSWLLKEPTRDVRKHLHDGIEYVDQIVEELNEQTPALMKPAAMQVLETIEGAGGYQEAQQALLKLYPQLDRAQLRDALTGATLLAQAAGRLTASREASEEGGAATERLTETVRLNFNPNQPRMPDGRFAPGLGVPPLDEANMAIRTFAGLPKGYPDAVLKRGKENPPADMFTPDGSSTNHFQAEAKARLGKLTKDETSAIKHYTGDEFQEVLLAEKMSKDAFVARMTAAQALSASDYKAKGLPPGLRGRSKEEIEAGYERGRKSAGEINEAVRRATPSPGVVYRGLNGLTEAQLQKFIDADTFTTEGITSTSRSFSIAGTNFATNVQPGSAVKNVVFVMHQHSAVSIESASSKKKEAELVLPKGKKFRILRRYAPNDRRLVVEMEEMTEMAD